MCVCVHTRVYLLFVYVNYWSIPGIPKTINVIIGECLYVFMVSCHEFNVRHSNNMLYLNQ